MNHPETPHQTEETPLDAGALALLAKARRRAAISVLIMLVGFMAIAGAVVYRLALSDGGPGARYALETVALPQGAEVISAQTQDGMLTITFRSDVGTAIRLFDGRTGELVREIAVVAE